MYFYIPKFIEMLTSINANVDLDQNNIINKMKDMVQEKYPGLYREWQDNGFDINHLFNQEFTLLHMAARCGFQKITEVLVEAGADINKKETQQPSHIRVKD